MKDARELKRVLVLTPGAYGVNGGIALYNRDVIEAIAAMDEVGEIIVIARELRNPEKPPSDKIHLIPWGARGKSAFIASTVAQAARRPDAIICGHINLLPLTMPIASLIRTPTALMVYGIDVWSPRKRAARAALRGLKSIWSISEITRNKMNEWADLPDAAYQIIPNAIHLDRYEPKPPSPELVKRLGLEGRKVIMTLARLTSYERYKGVDEVVECLSALSQHVPSLAYVVVGDGDDRPRLEAKAQRLGVADRVIFTGFVDEVAKADHYRLADAFVMPGRAEGFGFVFLEALASGVPAVGSLIDGSCEALRGGLLGELVDPNHLSSIEAGVLKALARPKGVPDGLAHFAWPAFQQKIAEGVRELLEMK